MGDEMVQVLATGPWALVAMFALVVADAALVVVPGEIAVTALGAIAVSTGHPPLAAVVVVAAAGAVVGDLACYSAGRWTGVARWRWARHPRVVAALDWARGRLSSRPASVVFTARFIPFARLAVNLAAGASRVPLSRYGPPVAVAAAAWAAYQAMIGAAVAALVPGGPVVTVLVSIGCALVLGFAFDALVGLIGRRWARTDSAILPDTPPDAAA